ncbi:MAG: helix-turn-helix domain-containing protein [Chitinophagaceae bacterium]|nr:helix-turn-helix domain-containing protein [Chitinophagaceae bacterium]
MLNVSILLYDDVVASSVTGVLDLLNGVNKYLVRTGKSSAFAIGLVSRDPERLNLVFPIMRVPHKSFTNAACPDLIIVPSYNVGNEGVVKRNEHSVKWIINMRERGSEVASMCVGSYFLAEAGLLYGKAATSHWAVLDDMRLRYPKIRIKSDAVITDQDGIYTSGGAFSSLKLIVYLIEKFCGRETALWASKMFAIEMDRTSQAYFALFTGQHQHEDKAILEAQLYMEKHFRDTISINDICRLVNMGNRNFIRRFKAATNNTPFEYLQRVRIESAKKAIERNDTDLPAIIEEAGYNDLKAFRIIFKRLTGLSPVEYKKKYARGT